jgi:hypothetical protein
MQLNLKLMGLNQWAKVSISATLDSRSQLQSFFMVLNAAQYSTRLEGKRSGPGKFHGRLFTAGTEQSLTIDIPDDAMLYSPMTEMAMRRLQPGQSLQLKVFDPLSRTTSDIRVQALSNELFRLDGRDHETTVLAISYQGMETRAWIDRESRILRQETPFGWTFQACSPQQAMASKPDGAPVADMLSALAVSCRGVIPRPRDCRKLRLVLRRPGIDPQGIASPRQLVAERTTNSLTLTLLGQAAPTNPTPLGPAPKEFQPDLAATPFVQADHPEMIRKAKEIVGNHSNSWEAATAIYEWVNRSVVKQSAISLPSALDVLHKLEGDCNEHTYLFVGLARAAGLPARIHVGLAYATLPGKPEGAFYYHAWPSVYVGEWVEMDPTFGQATVDATHLSLLTGELADQVKLLGFVGRTSADILSAE